MTAFFSILPLPSVSELLAKFLAKFRTAANKPKKVAPKGDELQLEREHLYEMIARDPSAVPNEISLEILMRHMHR